MKYVGQIKLNPYAPLYECELDYNGEIQTFPIEKGYLMAPIEVLKCDNECQIVRQGLKDFTVKFEKNGKTKPSGKLVVKILLNE